MAFPDSRHVFIKSHVVLPGVIVLSRFVIQVQGRPDYYAPKQTSGPQERHNPWTSHCDGKDLLEHRQMTAFSALPAR